MKHFSVHIEHTGGRHVTSVQAEDLPKAHITKITIKEYV